MIKKLSKGFFITLEGGEGAGKSTLLGRLKEYYQPIVPIHFTREPGSTLLGEEIRRLLLDVKHQVSIRCELALFLASRAEHVERIILPKLLSNHVVICDRFHDSTLVYQGHARGFDLDEVMHFCLFFSKNLMPDLTFYLDIDPTMGLKRRENSSLEINRLDAESLAFHHKVREGYQILAKKYPHRIVTIDARQSPEIIFQEVRQRIDEKLAYVVRV